MLKTVHIDLREIDSWRKFHNYFANFEGFPSYYGKNLDAWIDVMQDYFEEQCVLIIELRGPMNKYYQNEFYVSILDCIAFVNCRKLEESSYGLISVAIKNSSI